MGNKPTIRTRELREPLYELSIGGDGKYCRLMAEVYDNHGSRRIVSGRYPVTNFWRLGSLETMWRTWRGDFPKEGLEKLIIGVEQEWEWSDTQGKPFFVNGFLFTRMTGKSKIETVPVIVADGRRVDSWETGYESPVEFFQVEVDTKHRLK